MSKDYALIKAWYDMGLWDEYRLRNGVMMGKITAAEYEAISGLTYTPSTESE